MKTVGVDLHQVSGPPIWHRTHPPSVGNTSLALGNVGTSQADYRKLFRAIDRDGNRGIDRKEIVKLVFPTRKGKARGSSATEKVPLRIPTPLFARYRVFIVCLCAGIGEVSVVCYDIGRMDPPHGVDG